MEKIRLREERRALDREIWELLWPVLLLTLVQRLGSAFEGVLVSVNSANDLTITSLCSPYISLTTTVGYGLGVGVNTVVGHSAGQGQWQRQGGMLTRLLALLCLLFGAVISAVIAIGVPFSFQEAASSLGTAWRYLLPYMVGSPVILLYNAMIAIQRGLGNTKAGLYMTVISVPLQLLICYLCYTAFGIAGMGYGLLLSRSTACLWSGLRYFRPLLRRGEEKEKWEPRVLLELLRLVVPVSLSKAVTPAAHVLINASLLRMGASVLSANGLAGRFEQFFYLPAMAISTISITVITRRGDDGARRMATRRLCIWGVLPTLVLSALALLLAPLLWQQITPDPALRETGVQLWRICAFAYPLIATDLVLLAILNALRSGVPSLLSAVLRTWGVRLPLTLLAEKMGWGAAGAWCAFVAGNVAALLLSVCWTLRKLQKSGGSLLRRTD